MLPESPPSHTSAWRPLVILRRTALRLIVCWTIYTLSIGPMYWTWFGATYVSGPYWVAAFYSPLQKACEYVPYYGDLVDDYIWWWNFPQPSTLPPPDQQLVAG